MATVARENGNILHVRYGGRSMDLPLAALNLTSSSDEREIRSRLAGYLEVTPRQLDGYVVDRHPNGNFTLRPEAVFG